MLVSVRGYCPECKTPLIEDDLRRNPVICPGCKTKLQVLIKANWIYAILAVTIASVLARLQGYDSIIFAFWVLIYATGILFLIKFYRWEFHLPIKIVTVPNGRL
jgi:hypothetical protein